MSTPDIVRKAAALWLILGAVSAHAQADDAAVAANAWRLAGHWRRISLQAGFTKNKPMTLDEVYSRSCYAFPTCAADCATTLEWSVGRLLSEAMVAAGRDQENAPRPARLCALLAGSAGEQATPGDIQRAARRRYDTLMAASLARARGNTRDQLVCSEARLHGRADPAEACKRAEVMAVADTITSLAGVESGLRPLMAAVACLELEICSRPCPRVFAAVASLSPALIPDATGCPEMQRKRGETPEAWSDRGLQWAASHFAQLALTLRTSPK